MRILIAVVIALGAVAPPAAARAMDTPPGAHASALCADYPNQAAASVPPTPSMPTVTASTASRSHAPA
jgi:hypothetical protein